MPTASARRTTLSGGQRPTLGALLFIWAARSIRADIQRAGLSAFVIFARDQT
jgi:hypothetical protein